MKRLALLVLSLWLAVGLFGTTKVGGSGTTKVGGSGTTKVGTGYSGTPDVLWWKGNTGSGTTDTATVGPNCTLSSASAWGTTFTPGGSTADLVWASTYYASSASAVNPATNIMTVEFRLIQTTYSNATANVQWYLGTVNNVTSSAGNWKIYNDTNSNNNAIVVYFSDGGANNCAYSFGRPSASNWHHVAVVMNNSVSTAPIVYVDGSTVSVSTVLNQWASAGNFRNVIIRYGADDANANITPASMKDVRIWTGARSAANILLDATNYP